MPSSPTGKKKTLSKMGRAVRFLTGILDPRAYAHAFRLINYYNYAHVVPRRQITIGTNAAISPNAVFSNPERIFIGNHLRLGARCHLWAGHAHGKITIGDDVLFGPEVMVTAATYRFEDGQPVTEQRMDEADVTIGNDVWLGTRAIVLPGATIGDGAVIGAGAVVMGDIPAFGIAVGAPARVVRTRVIKNRDSA